MSYDTHCSSCGKPYKDFAAEGSSACVCHTIPAQALRDDMRGGKPAMTAARSDLMALKPCPFCGSEGLTLLRGYRYADDAPDRKENAVMCPTCAARAPEKSWNARLAASQLDREAVAKWLFNRFMRGHAQWDNTADPHKEDWLRDADAILSLLSGAGSGADTKSDGRTRDSLSSEEKEPVVTRACGPSDSSPGPDVREAFKSPIKCAACGKMYSDHAPEGDPVCECAARSVRALKEEMDAALTRPLGGFVQEETPLRMQELPGSDRQATEAEADSAIKCLRLAIDAAENSNQAGENAVVKAASAIGWRRA